MKQWYKFKKNNRDLERGKGMVSKSEQLEQLFIEWEYAQENEPDSSWKLTQGGENITKSHFRRDGIIDEAVFSKEKRFWE